MKRIIILLILLINCSLNSIESGTPAIKFTNNGEENILISKRLAEKLVKIEKNYAIQTQLLANKDSIIADLELMISNNAEQKKLELKTLEVKNKQLKIALGITIAGSSIVVTACIVGVIYVIVESIN